MTSREEFEKVYSEPGARWTMEEPPAILRELVEKRIVLPCETLDIACGEGMYGIYLARKGFDVTGIDFSEKAIEYAKQNAEKAKVKVKFINLDVTNLAQIRRKFDFALEWGLLHHLTQDELVSYIPKVSETLRKGGLYLTASFNINSPEYGKPGQRYRETPIGTKLFYRSQQELIELFEPHFDIIRKEISPLAGKGISQPGNIFLMRKK